MKLLEDDIPASPIDFPVKASASASASYNVDHKKITFDSKVYPPCTNKIEPVGVLRRRKFNIVCDGKGNMNMKEMISADERIKRLGKLLEDGYISKKEFKEKKKKLLDEM